MPDEPAADPGRLLDLIGGSWASQVVHVAAALGLADALADGPRTCPDLALAVDAHEPTLARLLRALVALELCEVAAGDRFAMTPTGALLASGEGSLAPWAQWWGGPAWAEWGGLLDAVRTGRSVRAADGDDGFGALAQDPVRSELFNAAMAGLTRLDAAAIVGALELDGTELVADVGGGHGELLRAVLERHPAARGMIVDLPHAVPGASERLAAWGLADRCAVVPADVFAAVPSGADAYVLKSVLHDWDDDDAATILRRVGDAMGAQARAYLVERVAPVELGASPAARSTARMDLHMLVAQGGRERTEPELRALARAAGLDVVAVRAVSATVAVVEVVAAVQPGVAGPAGS